MQNYQSSVLDIPEVLKSFTKIPNGEYPIWRDYTIKETSEQKLFRVKNLIPEIEKIYWVHVLDGVTSINPLTFSQLYLIRFRLRQIPWMTSSFQELKKLYKALWKYSDCKTEMLWMMFHDLKFYLSHPQSVGYWRKRCPKLLMAWL